MSDVQPRLLLIEDNSTQARAVQNCLSNEHDVALETSVEDVTTQLDIPTFDLIIVDWGLPGQSGLGFVRDLKDDPGIQDLPVMMLTGEDRSEHVQRAVEAGVDDYIVKPVYCGTLREKVASLLESPPADPQGS
jgi:DNA-binding response OmpR family regulator